MDGSCNSLRHGWNTNEVSSFTFSQWRTLSVLIYKAISYVRLSVFRWISNLMASSLTFRRQRGFEKSLETLTLPLSLWIDCVSLSLHASAPAQMWFPLLSQLSKSSVSISVSSCPRTCLQSLPLYLFSHCLSSTCYFQTVFKSAQIFSSLTSLPGLPVLSISQTKLLLRNFFQVYFFWLCNEKFRFSRYSISISDLPFIV